MVKLLTDQPKTGRMLRRPTHTFQLRHRPFVIQPFCIAPVLPGETMANALVQARGVVDPIKNPLIGWHTEYYLYYVKLTDLAAREDFVELMLQPNKDLSGLNSSAKADTYHYGGALDFVQMCLDQVVAWDFRDQGDDIADHQVDGMPVAALNMKHWVESIMDTDDLPGSDGANTAATPTPETLDDWIIQWEHMRALNMTTMSYEEWLKTWGVKVAEVEKPHQPELLRYMREWHYPVNTVDPADGTPSSAVSWATSFRADQDRLFKEPGFIFGVTLCRPKVYLGAQKGAGVHMLDTALSWLPAMLRDEPFTSLRRYAGETGPLAGATGQEGYWVDVRDLFIHGDQFINFSLSDTAAAIVSLPDLGTTTAVSNKLYPSDTDIDGLFVGTTDATRLCRQDGVVQFSIKASPATATNATPRYQPGAAVYV